MHFTKLSKTLCSLVCLTHTLCRACYENSLKKARVGTSAWLCSGRFRPGGVGEVSIRVDFKFGVFDPKQALRRDWETELFPERATQDDLRP